MGKFFGKLLSMNALWVRICHTCEYVAYVLFKKQISSSSDLLSNESLFGGQLYSRSNHERGARVIFLLTTDLQTVI